MKSFFFVRNHTNSYKYDVYIEHWQDTGKLWENRFKEVEMVRFLHYKATCEFNGRFDHERRNIVYSHKSVYEFLEDRTDGGFTPIDQKNYARYKKAVLSLYQQIISKS